jgi:hypothetical protein
MIPSAGQVFDGPKKKLRQIDKYGEAQRAKKKFCG